MVGNYPRINANARLLLSIATSSVSAGQLDRNVEYVGHVVRVRNGQQAQRDLLSVDTCRYDLGVAGALTYGISVILYIFYELGSIILLEYLLSTSGRVVFFSSPFFSMDNR